MARYPKRKKKYGANRWLYNCIVYFRFPPFKEFTCKKWRVSNLRSFCAFLDTKHPKWLFFNVYTRLGADPNRGHQIGNFTKNNRPKTNKIYT